MDGHAQHHLRILGYQRPTISHALATIARMLQSQQKGTNHFQKSLTQYSFQSLDYPPNSHTTLINKGFSYCNLGEVSVRLPHRLTGRDVYICR